MEDQDYQYPVYFQCNNLVKESVKKIETYFCKSGRECGPLRRVKSQIFRIDFKHQKDQQAVLQRSEHVVDGLELKVRDHEDPQTSSPNQDPPAPVEVSKSLQEDSQPDQASTTRRIVLVGKTGSGKSHLANTILGEELFNIDDSANPGTSRCKAETRPVNGRNITLIDTPGFFDSRPEKEMKPEIVRCIVECAPGPHAFLIVLKVEKFLEQEQAVIQKICEYFSPEALKYAVVVFTHGDQLPKGKTIEEFVNQNENLKDLVEKCSGRVHVIDNKYWTNDQHEYRNNRVQVEKLLETVEKMVVENNGDYYTNEMLQEVEKQIVIVEEHIKEMSPGNMTREEIRNQAKRVVFDRFLIELAGTTTGVLVGAFFGMVASVGMVLTALPEITRFLFLKKCVGAGAGVGAGGGAGAGVGVGEVTLVGGVMGLVKGVIVAGAVGGGVMGGMIGYEAAKEAKTPLEAMEMAAESVYNKGTVVLKEITKDLFA